MGKKKKSITPSKQDNNNHNNSNNNTPTSSTFKTNNKRSTNTPTTTTSSPPSSTRASLCQIIPYITSTNNNNINNKNNNINVYNNKAIHNQKYNYPIIIKLSIQTSQKLEVKDGALVFILKYENKQNNNKKDNLLTSSINIIESNKKMEVEGDAAIIGMVSIITEKDRIRTKKKTKKLEVEHDCSSCTATKAIVVESIYVLPKQIEDQFIVSIMSTTTSKGDEKEDTYNCTMDNNQQEQQQQFESPSKSKFSFHTTLQKQSPSPSNIAEKQQGPPKEEAIASSVVIVTPIASKIGTILQNNICTRATKIYLQPQPQEHRLSNHGNNNTNGSIINSNNCSNVLSHLIHASYANVYVQHNQLLSITFCGTPAFFKIVSIDSTTSHDSRVENENGDDCSGTLSLEKLWKNMSLEEGEGNGCHCENHLSVEHISNTIDLNKILMYQISYDTVIAFIPTTNQIDDHDNEQAFTLTSTPTPTQEQQQQTQNPTLQVGGVSNILNQLKDIFVPSLLTPWIFPSNSASKTSSIPKGVLLHGPSGVGKTLLSNVLTHMLLQQQQQQQLHIHNKLEIKQLSCTSLLSSTNIIGSVEHTLSSLFHKAYDRSITEGTSTLIILDNIEIICPCRNSNTNSGSNIHQITSTFLALLDGIGNTNTTTTTTTVSSSTQENNNNNCHGTVMLLAITNDPNKLDSALRRPGRLDIEIDIPIPDDHARMEILECQLQYLAPHILKEQQYLDNDGEDHFLLQLSKKAKGFTGADTLLALKEAMRSALLQQTQSKSSLSLDLDNNDSLLQLNHIQTTLQSFKPSTIRNILHGSVEVPTVHWCDIGGMDSVKSSLQEVLELHTTTTTTTNKNTNLLNQYYKTLNIKPPKGILLYGPPGCSKTLMARALATTGKMNFLAIKGPELLSKWLGESERSLATLFYKARQASPCIIFFDEIDAIASRRDFGGGGGGGDQRLLSQLLTEMDGVSSSNNNTTVLVVAATNRPDLLDPALLRPGRIDRMVYVGLPDTQSRTQILQLTLKLKACHDDVDIIALAQDKYTKGFSGAEIVAICREAALYAIEEYEVVVVDINTTTSSTTTTLADENNNDNDPETKVCMRHLLKAAQHMKRQITTDMLQFYDLFQKGKKRFS